MRLQEKLPNIYRWVNWIRGQKTIDLYPIRQHLAGYGRDQAIRDGRAGLNVALLAFPQGMAYALIAGLPIQYGLICFILASLVSPLFGSSRFNSYGPSNATSVLVMSSFLALQMDPATMLLAVPMLVLLAGVFLVVGAFLKVASLIQYVSRTVIAGYITAAALMIIANQVKNALGFEAPKSASFFMVVFETVARVGQTQAPSLLIASLTALIFLVLRRKFPSWPNVAITLGIVTACSFGCSHLGWEVKTLAAVSLEGLRPGLEFFSFETMSQLASPALVLAFLITVEANSIGKSLAARAGDRLRPNQEMFGLGVGNIASAFFGGMPASASLTRSSLSCQSGAATPLGNFFAALLVLALLLGLSGFIRFIPVPGLAVVVIFIGVSLINLRTIRVVSKATRSDAAVFFTTLAAGLLLALDAAIYLGVAVSIALFLRKVAAPEFVEYGFNQAGVLTELQDPNARVRPEVSIVHVEGELFFGAADLFYDQLRRVCEQDNLKVVVLKLRNAHRLDATSVMALEELVRFMKERGRTLLVSEARKEAIRIFKRSGLLDILGRDNVAPDNLQTPTLSTARALKRAMVLLGGAEADVSIYVDSTRVQAPVSP